MNKEVLASHVADIEAGMKEYMRRKTDIRGPCLRL